MPLFNSGDRVRYVGENMEHLEAMIVGIKVMSCIGFGRPIYYIKWDRQEETYPHGIMERNLKLIKRRPPDWEI